MRICLISPGLKERERRLQPWRYLLEAARALEQNGHEVYLVSDGYPRLPREDRVAKLPVIRLASLQEWPIHGYRKVAFAVNHLRPDIVLWNLGLTSFLRLGALKRIPAPVIGIFTSPIYRPQELLRLGLLRLLRGYRLSAIHLLGLLVPTTLVKRTLQVGSVQLFVVECETTRHGLIQRGVPGDRVRVIRPSIDPDWFTTTLTNAERAQVRAELRFAPEDFIVGYFGPPVPLRGLPTLLKAVARARNKNARIKLLVLSRQRDGELRAQHLRIQRLVTHLGAGQWSRILTGFLPRMQLIQSVAACDVIALPFEVVPSDVPLSVLEAMALGMPVITTQVASLPELVPEGTGMCVPPGKVSILADAISTLAADKELKHRLGYKGRERATSWETQSNSREKWDQLLRQSI